MANKTQMEYTINVRAKTDQAINDIRSLSNALNSAFAKGEGNAGLVKQLNDINKIIDRIEKTVNMPVTKEGTFTKMQEDANNVIEELNSLAKKITEIASSDPDALALVDAAGLQRLKDAANAIKNYESSMATATANSEKLKKAQEKLNDAEGKQKTTIQYLDQQNLKLKEQEKYRLKLISALAREAELKKQIVADPDNEYLQRAAEGVKQQVDIWASKAGYAGGQGARRAGPQKDRGVKEAQEDVDKATRSLNFYNESIAKAKGELDNLNQSFSVTLEKSSQTLWNDLTIQLQNLGYSIENINPKDLDKLKTIIASEDADRIRQATQELNRLGDSTTQAAKATQRLKEEQKGSAEAFENQSNILKAWDNIKARTAQIIGLSGAFNLLRRSMRNAFTTIKELDKIMTETAVVTNFSVGDMWEQMDQYAKRAKSLGVSIQDVYEASTLYYQQGLTTNQVTALTTQTLKMARIASLDAADATNRMTAALRGFNMAINETNAQNVSDVYSKLAAITASNVDEISTAMTKVASLANSANMSFENTSAFLAQIINLSVTCSREAA